MSQMIAIEDIHSEMISFNVYLTLKAQVDIGKKHPGISETNLGLHGLLASAA
jgi:hypothetical protein